MQSKQVSLESIPKRNAVYHCISLPLQNFAAVEYFGSVYIPLNPKYLLLSVTITYAPSVYRHIDEALTQFF